MKYTLGRVIGSGAMGTLYESVDPGTGRRIVVKVARGDADALAALRTEAEVARRLSHRGIVAVYEYCAEGGTARLAMEHVEGRTLQACFDQQMHFSVPRVLDIMSQLLEALQYAHEQGVWHRDINPSNILLTDRGAVKVADFGIARTPASGGTVVGTPGYVAPEAYSGEAVDQRVDVFAAGAVCYQLLAGVPPFVGSASQIMVSVHRASPVAPSIAAATTSLKRFDAVVLKSLARRPEDRFASAAQFREALLNAG